MAPDLPGRHRPLRSTGRAAHPADPPAAERESGDAALLAVASPPWATPACPWQELSDLLLTSNRSIVACGGTNGPSHMGPCGNTVDNKR